jgi:hypothetical protein
MRGALWLTLASVLGAALVAAQAPSDSVGRVTFRVLPETVTVGQPFMVNLRAVPAAGGSAVAPPVPDTGGIVEPLDPAVVTRRGDTLLVRYRLIAWQPGVLTIPLQPVQMRRERTDVAVPVDIRVVVASVLPADSASRIPRAPRELYPAAAPWWAAWWQWLVALLAALAAIYGVHRWRTRERPAVEAITSPITRAESAFARLDGRQLVRMGEGGRHVTLAAEIVRQYLADISPSLPLALTNAELLAAAQPITGIPASRLAHLLEQCDVVRFSGMDTDAETVRRVSGLARELVREMDRMRASRSSEAA